MRRGAAPVEKAGRGQNEGARADARNAARVLGAPLQPGEQIALGHGAADAVIAAAGNDDGIDGRR